MGNPTKEIRAKLDERGIEHVDGTFHVGDEDKATSWRFGEASVTAVTTDDGTLDLWIDHCTPEQAIAATVGEEHEMHICKRCGVAYELNIIDKGYGKPRFCPNCGHKGMYQ